MAPASFSWVEKPRLGALGRPQSVAELEWLRQQGIELLVSLTEEPPPREWINEAGLFLLHVPIPDMAAPTPEQLDRCLAAIDKAMAKNLGVAVHCGAGLGRTGAIIACYFVTRDFSWKNAIARVRRLRPGSIETEDQVEAVRQFALRRKSVES